MALGIFGLGFFLFLGTWGFLNYWAPPDIFGYLTAPFFVSRFLEMGTRKSCLGVVRFRSGGAHVSSVDFQTRGRGQIRFWRRPFFVSRYLGM